MLTVTAALIEDNGRILAARRGPGRHMSGFWEFPGGKQEDGESEEACLLRELHEELGVTGQVNGFFAESIHTYQEISIRMRCYHVRIITGTPQCRDHDRIHWFQPDELLELNWAPADIPLVKQLLNATTKRS